MTVIQSIKELMVLANTTESLQEGNFTGKDSLKDGTSVKSLLTAKTDRRLHGGVLKHWKAKTDR